MGLIHCMELDFSQIPEISNGIVKKDSFFDEVPTLNQKNLEKWAESKFEFKIKIEHEWYLGSFYNDDSRINEVSLSFSKFQ
ncbi:MAG: hypothetical protein FP812_07415 [Desulfobacula sp.]|nr:hypothetical protein [Desulfobacula sp.]